MAIKHYSIKQSNELGYASEWNEEHIIDSDVDFNNFSGINLGNPINSFDIATKNYVDTLELNLVTYIDNELAGISVEGDNLGNHIATQDLNMNSFNIINVDEPVSPSDVATKNYVDIVSGVSLADSGANFGLSSIPLTTSWSEVVSVSVNVPSTSSKVLIIATGTGMFEKENVYLRIQLYRDSTPIAEQLSMITGWVGDSADYRGFGLNFIDTGVSGNVVYKVKARIDSSVSIFANARLSVIVF